MDRALSFFEDLASTPFDLDMRVSLPWIFAAIILAFGVWLFTVRSKGDRTSFLAFLFPRKIYTHRSNLLDIKLYFVNRFVGFAGLTSALVFTPLVASTVLDYLMAIAPRDWVATPHTWSRIALATLIIVMASDFCKYWAHRLHHEWAPLWSFHAVHHSAEVMTPVTVSRAHPVEGAIRNLFISVLVGIVQAFVVYLLVGTVSPWTIAGANAFYLMFNAAGANLRHSHIWLRYGNVMEHVFISPAQHQIHHSRAKVHFNKNYGSMFALWDWVFGTLYIPPYKEELDFGVADAAGNPLEQPYPTLRAALLHPFAESWEALKKQRARTKNVAIEQRSTAQRTDA